jgi:hypothetical protein
MNVENEDTTLYQSAPTQKETPRAQALRALAIMAERERRCDPAVAFEIERAQDWLAGQQVAPPIADVHGRFDVTDLPDAWTLALQIARYLRRSTELASSGRGPERFLELDRARATCDALCVALDELREGPR